MAGKSNSKKPNVEDMASFCKRKGIVYSSGQIYGGLSGFYDFGPNGTNLKNNIKNEWRKFFVQKREDMVEIDGSILSHPKIWEASGHTKDFTDVFVNCKKCGKADKVDKHELDNAKCQYCGGKFDKENAKEFNLMFETMIGPDNPIKAFLRPETAQLIFSNFKQTADDSRMKLPFGIAQVGKAYRNEISPRNFLFRMREFEQMEIEYFIAPDQKCPYEIFDLEVWIYSNENQKKDEEQTKMSVKKAFERGLIKRKWHAYWLVNCLLWFKDLGCDMDNFRLRQHLKDELAHYATDCWDIEYKFPFGWKELTGIADRGNYDLSKHKEFSGKKLELQDPKEGKVLPHVVAEPSFGVERSFLVFMYEAYEDDEERGNVVLRLSPKLSQYKVAIFPLVKKDKKLVKKSREIYDNLKENFSCFYDESGSVGRRYARQDEIGTPLCITVDEDSLKDNTVTIRNRDTTEQIRVKIDQLEEKIGKLINTEIVFEKL